MNKERETTEPRTVLQDVREWQLALLEQILRVLTVTALLVLAPAIFFVAGERSVGFIYFYGAEFVLLLILQFVKRIPYVVKAAGVLILIYGLGIASLLRAGLGSNAQIFLIALPFTAMLLLGNWEGWVCLGVSFLTMVIFSVLFSTGTLSISDNVQVMSHKWEAWFTYTFTLTWAGAFFVMTQGYLRSRLLTDLSQSRAMAQELDVQRAHAERDAMRAQLHAEQMGWLANFGNTLASLRNRDLLTRRIVQDLLQNFALYQVNFYLTDRSGDVLTLVAAAGAQGQEWVNVSMPEVVGGRSLLGQVAQTGKEQARVLEHGQLAALPESRFEVALPLVVRGELLGILDIHSMDVTLSEASLQLFRIVAGYVSGALDTLRLFEESERQTHEMRMLYAQHVVASWRSLLEVESIPTYSLGALPAARARELAEEALRDRQSRVITLENDQGHLLVVPLIARDVTLGYLAFLRASSKGIWDQEALSLIEMAADRLALALDNTRLLVEVRRQAFYQEQLRRVDDVIWRNPSLDVVMEQSVRELGRFLGAGEVELYIAPVQHEETS
ncbi:MAG: GAF domain-containing protein [Anaerolineae bacterium]|nr:GAF domain-containing protein [Anaerolineae bacterium]